MNSIRFYSNMRKNRYRNGVTMIAKQITFGFFTICSFTGITFFANVSSFGGEVPGCRQLVVGDVVARNQKQEKKEDDKKKESRHEGDTNKFPHGGSVATNADVDRIMAKAVRYQKESNFRAASRFWLAALERAPGNMYSDDNELYYPMVQHIESKLAKLPPDGLKVYRIAADAQAEEILAAGEGKDELQTLQKVVDLAFLSSKGDQCALKLAGLYLDRFQSARAETLLQRIVDVYPNPDVAMDQVWLKLAISAYLNDNTLKAKFALSNAKKVRKDVSESLIASVEKMFDTKRAQTVTNKSTEGIQSSFGLGSQTNISLDLPKDYLQPKMAATWLFQHAFKPAGRTRAKYIDGEVLLGEEKAAAAKMSTTAQDRDLNNLATQWRKEGFRTTSTPIVSGGKILFKTQADLSGWHTDLEKTKSVLRSKNLNRYSTDAITNQLFRFSSNMSNYPAAQGFAFKNPLSLQCFGDFLYQSMSVYKGVVYSVEGKPFDRSARAPTFTNPNGMNVWSSPRHRNRETYLQAYDLATGKTLWDKPFPESDPKFIDSLKNGAVAGPSVGFKDNILFPYLLGDEMLLISVDRLTGKLVWKCSLCFLPEVSTEAGTSIQIALDGQTAFVVNGTGLISCVDAGSGKLNWVRKYRRSVTEKEQGNNQRFFGHMNNRQFNFQINGWEHDLAMSWGPWIVVAASDTDYLAAFRKSDGEIAWKADRAGVLGCTVDRWLGFYDGVIYATGEKSLIAYELPAEGRLFGTPQSIQGNISGQGFVCKSGIYLPVGDRIEKYDRKTLMKLGQYQVKMPKGTQLGSLVSDGKRIWSASLNRLFAITPSTVKESDPETKDSATGKKTIEEKSTAAVSEKEKKSS